MDISVIIPVYRVEKYIENCLKSVVNQSFSGSIECILVDDCGGDDSWKIVEDFVNNYEGNVIFKLIRHIHNKGVSAARNEGIRNASGEYLFFLDSDDTIVEDCFDILSQPLNDYSYDFVFANHRYICDNVYSIPLSIPEGPVFDSHTIKKYFRDGWYILVWNKLIKRSFIKLNRLYFEEGLIHEDELWSFSLACVAQSMYVINKETYNYICDNPHSITSDRNSFRHFYAYTEVLKKEILTLKNCGLTNNLYLCYQIEEAKRWRMKDAVLLLSKNQSYFYYMKLRNMKCGIFLFHPFDLKYILKGIIRDVHYLLPPYWGYKYICILNSISRCK